MGQRVTGGLVNIVAVGVLAPSNAVALFTLATAKVQKAIIRKIVWMNRTGGPGFLRIGYNDRTPAPGGPNFVQVLPDIMMVAGIDGELQEDDLPICGNSIEGFVVDTTAITGTTGDIMAEATVGAAGLNSVQVQVEVELF